VPSAASFYLRWGSVTGQTACQSIAAKGVLDVTTVQARLARGGDNNEVDLTAAAGLPLVLTIRPSRAAETFTISGGDAPLDVRVEFETESLSYGMGG
jgi:hypothetical protein